jgi:hypothetical protein
MMAPNRLDVLGLLSVRWAAAVPLFLAAASCGQSAFDADRDADQDAGPVLDLGCHEEPVDTDPDAPPPFEMDCREDLVDSFWGDAPAEGDRIALFNDVWNAAAEMFGGFAQVDADWDTVGEAGLAAVTEATSEGRFYQIMNSLFLTLGDGHSALASKRILGLSDEEVAALGDLFSVSTPFRPPLEERPPLFWLEDRVSTIGACVTLAADGESLVVYRVTADNPAGLAPGDRIVGYDGATWQRILPAIDACALPVVGRTASNDESRCLQRMGAVVNNAHLFEHLDVVRRGSSELEQIPTDGLIGYVSDLSCTDQIGVEGVEPPCGGWEECYGLESSAPTATWGVLPNTNIGYIYLYSWKSGEDFIEAVEALWDTDAMVIDQRNGIGGSKFMDGVSILFGPDPPAVVAEIHLSPDSISDSTWEYPNTYETPYDHPIAVLTGPQMGSGGDLFPWSMSFYPHSRRFGRTTDGRFSSAVHVWSGAWDPYSQDLQAGMSNTVFLDEDGESLFGSIQQPETPVWLTEDDIAAGRDTVVEAALDWIASQQ